MTTYIATLSPLEAYFFGAEKMSMAADRSDYFARTLLHPPQTTLLGMMRYEILGKNNALQQRSNWEELIGKDSFDATVSEQTFGCIQSLSPLFLSNHGSCLLPAPLDWGYTWTTLKGEATTNGQPMQTLPFLQGYKAKDGVTAQWIESQNKVKESEVFKKISQVGHAKNRYDISEDENFFLQEYVQMQKDYSFSFFVTLKEDDWDGYQNMVKIGGQQSPFALKFVKAKSDFDNLKKQVLEAYNPAPYWRMLLWSDAFVSLDIFKHSFFAMNDVKDFRNIQTNIVTTQKWANLERYQLKKEQPSLSDKKQLLSKGSVLLFDNEESLQKATMLIQVSHYQNIGYNHFSIVNPKLP